MNDGLFLFLLILLAYQNIYIFKIITIYKEKFSELDNLRTFLIYKEILLKNLETELKKYVDK